MSLPDRETSRVTPPEMNARARTPSHFISTAHSASRPLGGEPAAASMGASDAGSGDHSARVIHRSGTQNCPRPTPASRYLPAVPCCVGVIPDHFHLFRTLEDRLDRDPAGPGDPDEDVPVVERSPEGEALAPRVL